VQLSLRREVTNVPQDLGKVPEIGQRHGIEFLPPAKELNSALPADSGTSVVRHGQDE
jgi:hypothetical protein